MCVSSAVYILISVKQTPEEQKVALVSRRRAQMSNLSAGGVDVATLLVSLRALHFLKAPLKKRKNKA